jgi:ABC-type branched-subunit amino acid transport system substrate-binding protein
MALMTSACGARLTEDQRNAVLAGGVGPAGNPVVPGASVDPGASPAPGTSGGPGTSPGAPGSSPGAPGAAAEACPPGDNTASDKGVTATEIKLATIVDLSGPQTGLFTAAKQAMQAWAAYANNSGGICGRNVTVDVRDTRTSSGGNDGATKQSCEDDFAIVGSMSAFDDGGYPAGIACGIPAIPAISTNLCTEKHGCKSGEVFPPNFYPAYPNRADKLIDTASFVNQTKPDVKGNAGVMWLAQSVARNNAWARAEGYKQAGFNFTYTREAQVVEPNYSSYVAEMKGDGIKYLTFVGNNASIEQLLQAMDQQSYHPDFIDFDSVVYSPIFAEDLKDKSITTTNLYWFVNTALFEEASSNPEMQLYLQWLKQIDPNAIPDYFGLYAWSAGRLFQQVATTLGPKLTRPALVEALRKVTAWDSHGLHAPHQISQKIPAPCFLYGIIENYEFKRISPSSGWTCNRPLRNIPNPPPNPS